MDYFSVRHQYGNFGNNMQLEKGGNNQLFKNSLSLDTNSILDKHDSFKNI